MRQLRALVDAIAERDQLAVAELLRVSPDLVRARFDKGASRMEADTHFVPAAGRYIWAGDTALHFAAAVYQVRELIDAGAAVRARNRLGDEPLHAAACGSPGSGWWNPAAQAETIRLLVGAGADPNAKNKLGVAPLHKAVRTRCAAAVDALIACGADPHLPNKSGSTPLALAQQTTGRGGSGTPAAKHEQAEILRILSRVR